MKRREDSEFLKSRKWEEIARPEYEAHCSKLTNSWATQTHLSTHSHRHTRVLRLVTHPSTHPTTHMHTHPKTDTPTYSSPNITHTHMRVCIKTCYTPSHPIPSPPHTVFEGVGG
ncbi:hypothetical protein CEXT_78591 [Caerostris extrusa]|uniref:Uncharacterized protein n=1 Tax=Caerostris extrusa TaxID=172846 RepID=A0AAV4MCS2_CAEEX|nr:hypothetical protein CEXT_78591 [Caerostris extrusa]